MKAITCIVRGNSDVDMFLSTGINLRASSPWPVEPQRQPNTTVEKEEKTSKLLPYNYFNQLRGRCSSAGESAEILNEQEVSFSFVSEE